MPQMRDRVSALRTVLAQLEPAVDLIAADLIPFGSLGLDQRLGGGLRRGAMHEVYAADPFEDPTAASALGLGMALRASRRGLVTWIRQDEVDTMLGQPHGTGLAAFGADPARFILVRVPDHEGVFRAAREALRCPALGVVLAETWGASRTLDLNASRRLALEAEKSGVTLTMVRLGISPVPSAATTRWSVAAAASASLEANAPGRPAFTVTLLRHRAGIPGRTWHLEWDCDQTLFADPAPLSRPMVPVPARRTLGARDEASWRMAG